MMTPTSCSGTCWRREMSDAVSQAKENQFNEHGALGHNRRESASPEEEAGPIACTIRAPYMSDGKSMTFESSCKRLARHALWAAGALSFGDTFFVTHIIAQPTSHATSGPIVRPSTRCAPACSQVLPSLPPAYSGTLKILSRPVSIAITMPTMIIACAVTLWR